MGLRVVERPVEWLANKKYQREITKKKQRKQKFLERERKQVAE